MSYTNKNQNEINVGVDTGKYQLDIYIRPLDIFFSVSNDDKGIKEAMTILKKHQPKRIIIEATGRLEHAFIRHSAPLDLNFRNKISDIFFREYLRVYDAPHLNLRWHILV